MGASERKNWTDILGKISRAETVSKAELDTWLGYAEGFVQNLPVKDYVHVISKERTLHAVKRCIGTVSDEEAAWVSHGIAFGMNLNLIWEWPYRVQLHRNRTIGQKTRIANLARRNDAIVDQYWRYAPDLGSLKARQLIRDTTQLTLKQVNNVLAKKGVKYN